MESLVGQLGQYGVLGIFCGIFIFVGWYLFKQLINQIEKRLEETQKRLEETQKQLDETKVQLAIETSQRMELQKKFDDYLRDDSKAIREALTRSNQLLEKALK